jgi:L-glyceraldehyde 3-phosphate reductase
MHTASESRYDRPENWFRRCGASGLRLPAVSLGCWHNFGAPDKASSAPPGEAEQHENCRRMLFTAFDHGITHFDLANNYGPPPGSAEERVGRILRGDLAAHRDELVVSSKAGYGMWPGPYGDGGSRKYMIASCDQSLRRMGLEYVDIFYSHRPDPDTPVEETMGALDSIVRAGKALYVGLSNYSPEQVDGALRVCEANGFVKPVIHQPRYNLVFRQVEEQGLFGALDRAGMGSICFSPLEGGWLTGKYLDADPKDSRKNTGSGGVRKERFEPEALERLRNFKALADQAGLTLTQFALLWAIREGACTSALIGASRPAQIEEAAGLLDRGPLGNLVDLDDPALAQGERAEG